MANQKEIGLKKALFISLAWSAIVGGAISYLALDIFSIPIITSIMVGGIVFVVLSSLLTYLLRNAKPAEKGANK